MSHKFTIHIEIDDDPWVDPKVDIDGDLEGDDFATPLLRGVVEVLVLLRSIGGKEPVQEALKRQSFID